MLGEGESRPLGIVVVNYASADLIDRNLTRSAARADADIIVVVDNFSTATERTAIDAVCTRRGWTLVAPERNLGFGEGVNLGADAALAAGALDLLLLNPDAVVEEGCVPALRGAAARHDLALLSPRVLTPSGGIWFDGADLFLADGRTAATRRRGAASADSVWEWLSGACLWVSSETWRAIGGFQGDYFLYWEDVDLSRRVALAGGALEVVPDAVVVHDEGATHRTDAQGSRAKSETYYFYNIRNRMLFARRHLDAAGVARWRRGIPRSALDILLRGGRRQFLTSIAPWRAGIRGVLAARRVSRGRESHRHAGV